MELTEEQLLQWNQIKQNDPDSAEFLEECFALASIAKHPQLQMILGFMGEGQLSMANTTPSYSFPGEIAGANMMLRGDHIPNTGNIMCRKLDDGTLLSMWCNINFIARLNFFLSGNLIIHYQDDRIPAIAVYPDVHNFNDQISQNGTTQNEGENNPDKKNA